MSSKEAEVDRDAMAEILEAFAHPVRLTILEVLREKRTMPLADLRREVSERYAEVDHRNVEFHVTKMQFLGAARLHQEGGKKMVTLLVDITLPRVKRL